MEKVSLIAYSRALWLLLLLFCFRVSAQLAVCFYDVPFLPAFERWHSDSMPYAALVFFQLIIILIFSRIALQFQRNQVVAHFRVGVFLLIIGGLYFFVMSARLLNSLVELSEHAWWNQPIPSAFHLVLASFLIVVGLFHCRHGREQ